MTSVDAGSDVSDADARAGGADGAAYDAAPADSSAADASPEPPVDATIDAAPDAAAAGPVSVTAFDSDWKPLNAADVIIGDPTGAMKRATVTNVAGVAMITVPIGGMVTVADRNADVEYLTTVTGVQPSDILTTINLDTKLFFGPQIQTSSVALPGPYSGATYYEVASNCESTLGPVANTSGAMTGDIYRDCPDALGRYNVIEMASAQGTNRIKALAFSYGSTSDSSGWFLALTSWTPTKDIDLTVKNIPAAAVGAAFGPYISYRDAAIEIDRETVSTNVYRFSIPDPVVSPSTLSILATLEVGFPSEGDIVSAAFIRQSIPVDASSPTIDASTAPPRLHGIVISDSDLGRPRTSWQLDADPPAGLVGGEVFLYWPSPGTGKPAVQWSIIIPPQMEVRAPELPATIAALIPKVTPKVAVVLGEIGSKAPTYAALRGWFIPYLDLKLSNFQRVTFAGNAFK